MAPVDKTQARISIIVEPFGSGKVVGDVQSLRERWCLHRAR